VPEGLQLPAASEVGLGVLLGRGSAARAAADATLSHVPIADRLTRQRLIREIEARYHGRFSSDVLISHAHLVRRHRSR
jgi:hypothetical protein